MKKEGAANPPGLRCPDCNHDTFYRYGTARGKRRYLCLICGRQFTANGHHVKVKDRPLCPRCGKPMHLYRREEKALRFRCSVYPDCRTYTKIIQEITP